MGNIIDGKQFAAGMRKKLANRVESLKSDHQLTPGLAVVLVGEDPASQVYVRNKGKQAVAAGIQSFEHRLPADTPESTLLELVDGLNRDPAIHGILVQLPLPDHIQAKTVLRAVDPNKDVDGFHPLNVGGLVVGEDVLVPCTPLGCLLLLKAHAGDLSGQRAMVLGRSNIVGKPMASLLLREHCTVTIAHSRTRDLRAECLRADILVAAVGRPEMVKGDWINPGATVIDVGINRMETGDGKTRLVGDVDFAEASRRAKWITPVPGGVGPMTIACLLHNTVKAACMQNELAVPIVE
ncbi:MAG: bifunctional methylenetetrahydrofolate dehydrogenase/methenyltetrahydrofolate cyclohydrolase FolD [Gammaproteobacteria bacterium]|nr:bifunctional methylenetetrahydrofolate dehydrogenase/methenyltetrahydrofolate cyclohydrolase FolD [Gammaproteobacteria bacterium]